MATIKDIAKSLNISVSTVSYALNGGPRPVPSLVREKVLLTAKELGYRPNRAAKALITGRTHTIGIVPSYLGTDFALSPFFLQSLNGIINECEKMKYDVVLMTSHDQNDTEALLDVVLDGRIDGLIFLAPPIDSRAVNLVVEHNMPVVLTGHKGFNAASFSVDNEDGVRHAMNHLVSLGHRKIGHLYGLDHLEDAMARKEAFLDFVEKEHLDWNPSWIAPGDFNPERAFESGLEMLKNPNRPTAVFCANDESAIGLYRAARQLGLSIPNDLSVVGFDNATLGEYCHPTLTTVAQPLELIAAEALRAVVAAIENNTPSVSKVFPTKLIVRESTAPLNSI